MELSGDAIPIEDSLRTRFASRPLGSLLLLVCLLLLTRYVRPLGIVVVWPLLFFIPGWLLVSRVAPRLSPVGRVGLAVVTSVVLAAHLVNLAGRLAGRFDEDVALAAAFVLAAASFVLATRALPGLGPCPRISLRALALAARRYRGAWLTSAFGVVVVGGVLGMSAWHQVDGNWISGGWNWSDFLVHVSIGSSLQAGNFPPQVPYAAGNPLAYHWFADFHGAIAATTGGVGVIPVFIASNALLAGAFVLLVWELARVVLGDRRAAIPAAVLALFGGGLGWIRLPMDLAAGRGDLGTLLSTVSYDNVWAGDWPLFHIASVLGTGFLPHRATAFGLPILVGVILLAHVSLGRNRVGVALAGLLAALLAPFHFFFFPAAYVIVFLRWLAGRSWRDPGWRLDALAFLGPALLSLPFIVGPILLQQGRGAFQLVAGWSEAPLEEGAAATVFFYLTNLGIPLVLAVIAQLRPGLRWRGWLLGWAAAMFIIPNVVVVSVVVFDMNKYFQVMAVALALLAGWLVRTWPRPVLAAVLAACAISPALVAVWHVESQSVALTGQEELAGRWIAANVPQRAVFVTDAFVNSPVDISGRLRITSYGPYVANLGFDPDARGADVHRAYCDGDAAAAEVMAAYGATYVLSSGGLLDCPGQPTDFGASPLFATVYDAGGTTIWKLLDR